MARHLHDLGTLTILSTATTSQVFAGSTSGQVQAVLGAMSSLVVFAPAVLPEVVNVQVSPLRNAPVGDASWRNLQWQPGTDILIAANKAVNIPLVAGFRSLKLVSGAGVAADRVFTLIAQVDADYEP